MKPAPPVISTRFFRISLVSRSERCQQRQENYSRVVSSTDGPATGRRESGTSARQLTEPRGELCTISRFPRPTGVGVGTTDRAFARNGVLAVLTGCAKSVPGDSNDPSSPARPAALPGRRLLERLGQQRAHPARHRPEPPAHPGDELRSARDRHRGHAGAADEEHPRADPEERLLHRRGRRAGAGGRPGRRHPGRSRQWSHQREHHQHPGRRGGRGGLRPERRHAHRGARRAAGSTCSRPGLPRRWPRRRACRSTAGRGTCS